MSMNRVLFVHASLLCICGCGSLPVPNSVHVEQGKLSGSCDGNVCQYLGIPFAAPPVGELRWRPPQPAPNWQGTFDANKFGDQCLQPGDDDGKVAIVGNESCLFLNVWAPRGKNKCYAESCAVMFWIHGGAYMGGSGDMYNGTNIVSMAGDVLVVTTNYRLGVLGFLGSRELRNRDVHDGSTGNYGIQDQRAAIQWVRKNIHSFGGDKGNVMIFGESAGGGSVSMHLTMQRSWGLYRKAAIESGAFSYWTAQPMHEAEQQYHDIMAATGCTSHHGGASCLVGISAKHLVNVTMSALTAQSRPYGCPVAPTVDGVELTQFPWDLRDKGLLSKVPVLMGYNKDEGTIGVDAVKSYRKVSNMTAGDFARVITTEQYKVSPALLPEILDVYSVNKTGGDLDYINWYWAATHFYGDYLQSCPSRRTARALNKFSQNDVYMYYFAHTPRAPPFAFAGIQGVNNTSGASHAAEIEFVFSMRSTANGSGMPHLIGQDEEKLAHTMSGYWINFARTSNPNWSGVGAPVDTNLTIAWAPFVESRETSIRFDLPRLSTAIGLNDPQCDIIDKLEVLTPAPQQQDKVALRNYPGVLADQTSVLV